MIKDPEFQSAERAQVAELTRILTLQRAILSSANYAIISMTTEGVVTTFNSTAECWLGYAAAEIVGQSTPALWHEADELVARTKVLSRELGRTIEPGFESLTAKARLGQSDKNEWTLIRKDRSRFPVTLSATRLVDENGAITGFLGILADITERKQAERALRESEERFRRSFEDAPIGLALVSLEGRWLRVNRPICEMVGYSESELLATDFQSITHPDDLQTDLNFVHQLLDGKIRDYRMEKRYFHKQGQVINVLLSVSLVRDVDGKPFYFVSQIQDITETKRHAAEREKLILQLQRTLAAVKTLSSLLPICASCKKIRDDKGYWNQVEVYVADHSDAHFSHGLCPACEKKFNEDATKMFRRSNQSPEI